jgi:hypothetical protein
VIVYRVRIEITRPERRAALIRYLRRQHLPDLLAQPGFRQAELRAVEGEPTLIAEYRVASAQHLKRYLKSAAPALRADVQARFGDAIALSREISRPLAPASGRAPRSPSAARPRSVRS